jgi:hypothetical protein
MHGYSNRVMNTLGRMSHDEEPLAFSTEAPSSDPIVTESALGASGSGSAVEPIRSEPGAVPAEPLATPIDVPSRAEPLPELADDGATHPQHVDQDISARRDAYAAGRDLTINHYGADPGALESVRLFNEEQRTEVADSYLQQAVRQAEVTFRMSVWFITAGGLVVLAAVVLGLVHSSTPHSVSFVSGLAGLLIGSGGGAFAIRADKSRKHLSQAMRQVDAEVQEERRFTREAWRYAQATKAISDIRDDALNDQARVELARMILSGAQSTVEPPSEPPSPDAATSAVRQSDDAAQPHQKSRRRRP